MGHEPMRRAFLNEHPASFHQDPYGHLEGLRRFHPAPYRSLGGHVAPVRQTDLLQRALGTGGFLRRADQGAKIHERLIEAPRPPLRQETPGKVPEGLLGNPLAERRPEIEEPR